MESVSSRVTPSSPTARVEGASPFGETSISFSEDSTGLMSGVVEAVFPPDVDGDWTFMATINDIAKTAIALATTILWLRGAAVGSEVDSVTKDAAGLS